MDRLTVVRVTLCATLAVLAACADAPVAPLARAPHARPAFQVGDGNPPPPPADGFTIGGGGQGCVPTPTTPCPPPPPIPASIEVTGVRADVLVNPPANFAFARLETWFPPAVVSPDARVQESERGLVGRGTILWPITYATGIPGDVGVVDLGIVTGSIASTGAPGSRRVVLSARLTRPDGSDIIVTPPTGPPVWYRYAELRISY